jgi:hypothetical protein
MSRRDDDVTTADVTTRHDEISAALVRAHRRLTSAKCPGDELDAADDLQRCLLDLLRFSRDEVKRGAMSCKRFHFLFAERWCGQARCPVSARGR